MFLLELIGSSKHLYKYYTYYLLILYKTRRRLYMKAIFCDECYCIQWESGRCTLPDIQLSAGVCQNRELVPLGEDVIAPLRKAGREAYWTDDD